MRGLAEVLASPGFNPPAAEAAPRSALAGAVSFTPMLLDAMQRGAPARTGVQKSNRSLLAACSISSGYFLQTTACKEPLKTHSWRTGLREESSKRQSRALPRCGGSLKWPYRSLSLANIKLLPGFTPAKRSWLNSCFHRPQPATVLGGFPDEMGLGGR